MKTIYFLWDYDWVRAELLSEGSKNNKLFVPSNGMLSAHERRVPKDKCAEPEENVCVVWEKGRGTNGRGGYRVERELYPEHRVPACKVSGASYGPGRVDENEYGNGVAT